MFQRWSAARLPDSASRLAIRSGRKLIYALSLLLCAPCAVPIANVAVAQNINPFIPPVACCEPNCNGSPSSFASCVPVPYVPIPQSQISLDPTAQPAQMLTIHEAIRIALGNSEVVRNLGLVDAHSEVDIIRGIITTYDPRAAYAAAAGEWGIFDPMWTTEMQWDRIDIPPGTSFSGIGNRPPELDTADFYTSLEQLLPLGSRVRADYVTNYLFNPDNPINLDPNPQYFSYAQFGLVQPLMQGLGVPVTMAPIRIAAAEAERTDWQFKQEVLALVRSVETAYWQLYSEQQNLKALDEALPLFREIVRVREQQAQGAAGTESEVARAVSEMLLYEQRRLDTLSRISEQQLVLRNLMGLPVDDARSFRLIALPVTTPLFQTLGDAVTTAVNERPDVLRQRIAVYVAQQERIVARDSLRPKLDFNAFWRINGLGEDLGESLDVIGQNDFHDWQLGFQLQVPLGRRQGRANVRAAELLIQKQRALLDQTAHQASYEVADAYRRIIWLHQQHRVSSSRVDALTKWRAGAQAQFENPPPGISTVLALELYLNNLRDFVEASIRSNAILADYNSALARLEEVKGTLLESRLIEVAGDRTEELPEELPAPTTIELPNWMVVPQTTVNPEGGSSSTTPVPAPTISAAPTTPPPALVQPDTATQPLAIPAAPATPIHPPVVVPSPPVANTYEPPVATQPPVSVPNHPVHQPPLVTNGPAPEVLPYSTPPERQQPRSSAGISDRYVEDGQPRAAQSPSPQAMSLPPNEPTVQVSPSYPVLTPVPVQSAPDAIRLTLPSGEMPNQGDLPSRLILRPDVEVEEPRVESAPLIGQMPAESATIAEPTEAADSSSAQSREIPEPKPNTTWDAVITDQPATPPASQGLQLPDLYEATAVPVELPAAPKLGAMAAPAETKSSNLRQPAGAMGASESWATAPDDSAQQVRRGSASLINPEAANLDSQTDSSAGARVMPERSPNQMVESSKRPETVPQRPARADRDNPLMVPLPPVPPPHASIRPKILLDPATSDVLGLQRIDVEPRLAQKPTFGNPETQYVDPPQHNPPMEAQNDSAGAGTRIPSAVRQPWPAPAIVDWEGARLTPAAPAESKRMTTRELAHPSWIGAPRGKVARPPAPAQLINPAAYPATEAVR